MKTAQFLPLIILIVLISVLAIPAETTTAQFLVKIVADGITLKASPTTVIEGEPITFYGTFHDGGITQKGASVRLVDSSNASKEIGTGVVLGNGSYSIEWKTNSNDVGKHKIYAWSTSGGDDVLAEYSQTIVVTVNPPKLTLNVSPLSVTEGDSIRISGSFLRGDNVPIEDKPIMIVDSSKSRIIDTAITDAKGQYLVNWDTTPSDIGSHKIYAVFGALTFESLSRASSSSPVVTVDVLAPPPEIRSLMLDVNPTSITEGEKIIFSGSYTSNENPLSSREIIIMDETTNELVLTTTTNPDGSYLQEWFTTNEDIGVHTFYAQILYDPNNLESQLDVSTKHIVTISPEIPILVLDPLPAEVEEGDIINITGYITTDDFYDNRVRININNEQSRFLDKINLENIFSVSWRVSSEDIGINTIYAECICDEQNLQTLKQTVTVYGINTHDPPLKATIIPSSTTGEAPLNVTFRSSVSGGSQSYQYDWDVSGTKYNTSVVSHTFHNANESYSVKLTVIDSNQQTATAVIYISVRDPQRSDPEILVSGIMEESSEITFTAGGSYSEKVDSYEWDFGDGDNGYSREINHSYDDDGQYPIKLTISDKNGKISIYKTLNIKNKAPVITSLYSEKSEIETNEPVRIEGKFTDPGKDDTFTVIWKIDNKEEHTNEIVSPQTVKQVLKFEKPDTYHITLAIIDDDGDKDEKSISIKVENPFPWILVVAGAAAAVGGGGIVAAKTLIKPPTSPTPNTSSSPEPPTEPKPVQTTVTVEYRSGIEK